MDIFLIDPEGPQLHLPVNPFEITINKSKRFETINILNLGEVDFASGEQLKEIAFASLFPAEHGPFCRYANIPKPEEAMSRLERWTESDKPVRLIVTTVDINLLVFIIAQRMTIRGGEPGDIYYELSLRAWREVKINKVSAAGQGSSQAVATTAARPDTKPVPKVYVVVPGDTLFKIAKMQLGSGDRWKQIYEQNRTVIGNDPNRIHPGQKLVMS